MWRGAGAELFVTYFLHWLAEARRLSGDVEGARAAVDEALHHVERRDERFQEAELLRLQGELLLESAPRSAGDGIASLERAAQVARRQGARTFERKALTSLDRALAAETGAASR